MPLCSPRACGCALTSESLDITGSGGPGDPFVIENPFVIATAWRLRHYGADYGPEDGSLQILAETSVVTTNGSAVGTVNYGMTFLVAPGIVGVGGDAGVPIKVDMVGAPGLTSFQFTARNNAGTLMPSSLVRINWIGIGLVAA